MPLTGTNKLCQQCVNTCKQWAQVKVVICPYFLSNQKKKPVQDAKLKRGGTLTLRENAVEACAKAFLKKDKGGGGYGQSSLRYPSSA